MKKKNSFSELRNNEKRARQDAIIESAKRVFAVKPFNKVSIRDIAGEAGISHASIYRYFPDQQSLFLEAYLHGAREITAILSDIIEKGGRKTIEKVADAYLNYLLEHDQYCRMMNHFMLDGSLSAEMVDKLNASERLIFDQFDILFRKANMPEPVRPLSHAFFAALNGVHVTFRNYPGRTPAAVHQHIHHIARVIVDKFCAAAV
ncbi:MAG: TetR/AcrR family transcriptional regulator [Smithella sp.]|jgi:AcrR family transcriptional regulator